MTVDLKACRALTDEPIARLPVSSVNTPTGHHRLTKAGGQETGY